MNSTRHSHPHGQHLNGHAGANGHLNGHATHTAPTTHAPHRIVEPRKAGVSSALTAHAKFLAEFISNPGRMGAVAASSPNLAKRIADQIDFSRTNSIVEFGPGTGVVTKELLARMKPGTKFFAIERSADLAKICRQRLPQVKVYEESAEIVDELCRREGIESLDVVVSGLPWASFPDALQDRILESTLRALKPGGRFVMFGYRVGLLTPAGRRFHAKLPRFFDHVRRSNTVWLNLPPALVFTGVRKAKIDSASARTKSATAI
ncbi:MAG: methyltransferase domain-containing protein [Phycisphaeraceae bacterium]|nr:methyltransferase domain-containing protein [Phycisphaeraceae bacterium]